MSTSDCVFGGRPRVLISRATPSVIFRTSRSGSARAPILRRNVPAASGLISANASVEKPAWQRPRAKPPQPEKRSTLVKQRLFIPIQMSIVVDLTLPTEARRRIMRAIRGRGNKSTELAMAALLRRSRLTGWRRHLDLPGRPDFAWPAHKVALFVDGCFWHGCPRCYRTPSHNTEFWQQKVLDNRRRDRRADRALRSRGWRVLRVWECRLESTSTIRRVQRALRASPRPVQ